MRAQLSGAREEAERRAQDATMAMNAAQKRAAAAGVTEEQLEDAEDEDEDTKRVVGGGVKRNFSPNG